MAAGQVNHVNTAKGQDNAPNNAANDAPHNVLQAGSSAQPVVPAPVAAAASSGGGMREQAINLVHGVLGELASSTYSSSCASDTVASNMSIVSTSLSRGVISHANLMPMATYLTYTSTSGTNTSGMITGTGVPSIARSPLTSVCSALGVQLPLTIRAKLVNSEFADFGQLLEKK